MGRGPAVLLGCGLVSALVGCQTKKEEPPPPPPPLEQGPGDGTGMADDMPVPVPVPAPIVVGGAPGGAAEARRFEGAGDKAEKLAESDQAEAGLPPLHEVLASTGGPLEFLADAAALPAAELERALAIRLRPLSELAPAGELDRALRPCLAEGSEGDRREYVQLPIEGTPLRFRFGGDGRLAELRMLVPARPGTPAPATPFWAGGAFEVSTRPTSCGVGAGRAHEVVFAVRAAPAYGPAPAAVDPAAPGPGPGPALAAVDDSPVGLELRALLDGWLERALGRRLIELHQLGFADAPDNPVSPLHGKDAARGGAALTVELAGGALGSAVQAQLRVTAAGDGKVDSVHAVLPAGAEQRAAMFRLMKDAWGKASPTVGDDGQVTLRFSPGRRTQARAVEHDGAWHVELSTRR